MPKQIPIIVRLVNNMLVIDECWVWQKVLTKDGYGQTNYVDDDGTHRTKIAHKLMYEQIIGPVPDGLELDHICENRACINPIHLEPVTPLVNKSRSTSVGTVNANKTHCSNGHEYTKENTAIRVNPRGKRSRQCITCRLFAKRKWARKNRLEKKNAKSTN